MITSSTTSSIWRVHAWRPKQRRGIQEKITWRRGDLHKDICRSTHSRHLFLLRTTNCRRSLSLFLERSTTVGFTCTSMGKLVHRCRLGKITSGNKQKKWRNEIIPITRASHSNGTVSPPPRSTTTSLPLGAMVTILSEATAPTSSDLAARKYVAR